MNIKPLSEGEKRRRRAFAHNGLNGSTLMAESIMERIIRSDSTTLEAKRLAQQIALLLLDLRAELKTRVDPDL